MTILWRKQPSEIGAVPAGLGTKMLAVRIGFCLAAIWAIFAAIALVTYRDAWTNAGVFATDVSTLISAGIARDIEVYDLSIQAVARNSQDPELMGLPAALRGKVLFDQSADASGLGSLLVLDRDGRVVEDSKGRAAKTLDLSDRDYFIQQRDHATDRLYVSDPFISRITGKASFALSHRRSAPDGAFAGAAVGSIKLSLIGDLFASVHLPEGSTITLIKRDGAILLRAPVQSSNFGRSIMSDTLEDALSRGTSGTYRKASIIDGVDRLFAFRQLGALPVYLTVGLSTREFLVNWRWEVAVIGAGFVLLSAVILLLGLTLAGELRRRAAAERRLSDLAATDGLTMLANRRCFDEMLESEWRRAARSGSPLALLMIDGDFFKAFNDTYGHLEGDRALREIAAALRTCVERSGDLVARYGGEEFAVLLPGTTLDGAVKIAAAMRRAVSALALVHAASRTGLLTVSVGVASCQPTPGTSSRSLVEAADAALYVAKGEGRNRIVVEGTHPALRSRHAA